MPDQEVPKQEHPTAPKEDIPSIIPSTRRSYWDIERKRRAWEVKGQPEERREEKHFRLGPSFHNLGNWSEFRDLRNDCE
jgi:hypothetical protein